MSCSWSLMWIGRIMEIYRGQKIFRCWQWKKLKIPSRYFSVHLFQKGSRSFNFRCNAPVRRIKMSENLEEKIFWLKNQLRRSKSIHQLSLVKKLKEDEIASLCSSFSLFFLIVLLSLKKYESVVLQVIIPDMLKKIKLVQGRCYSQIL